MQTVLITHLAEENKRIQYLSPVNGYLYMLAGHQLMTDIAMQLLLLDKYNSQYSHMVQVFAHHNEQELPELKRLFAYSSCQKREIPAEHIYETAFISLQTKINSALMGLTDPIESLEQSTHNPHL